MKAFPIGTTMAGKTEYKICSYQVDHVYQVDSGKWIASTIPGRSGYARRVVRDFVEIPCGKCIGCRLDYSRQWANRMLLELEYHDVAWFVTLTYDNNHVPLSYYGDPASGEALPAMTVCKRDFQLFMKRLRKAYPDDKIRYYCCSEYGPETQRPHYHCILYGLHLDDVEEHRRPELRVRRGHKYFQSLKLESCWSADIPSERLFAGKPIHTCADEDNPRLIGNVIVAPVTWETCAYCARYVTKKLSGEASEFYTNFNIEPPFSLMSRKPGLARQWYDDHPGVMDYEYINVSTPEGGRKFRPPKYYNKLYDIDYPEKSAELRETRKRMAEASKKAKLSNTNLSYLELLAVEESNLERKMTSLKRGDI